jgi:hypothetical protein
VRSLELRVARICAADLTAVYPGTASDSAGSQVALGPDGPAQPGGQGRGAAHAVALPLRWRGVASCSPWSLPSVPLPGVARKEEGVRSNVRSVCDRSYHSEVRAELRCQRRGSSLALSPATTETGAHRSRPAARRRGPRRARRAPPLGTAPATRGGRAARPDPPPGSFSGGPAQAPPTRRGSPSPRHRSPPCARARTRRGCP